MKIRVLLFASYREKTGVGRICLDLADGATIADLTDTICRRFPQMPDSERIVVAVNNEYQDRDFILNAGDEAALIPPVSGGSL